MFNVFINAWKVKEIRNKILYTLMIFAIVRLGTIIAIPGIDVMGVKEAQQSAGLGTLYSMIAGGANSQWSIFAMGIGPYITSSIIMQLLTIAIPKLEEMQKDGEDGRRKILEYTRYVTVALALLQSSAMAIGFGRQGFLIDYNAWSIIVAICSMTAGSAFLMWCGEQITEHGVGNGISIVLLFNIISSVPNDGVTLFTRFIRGKKVPVAAVSVIIIAAIIFAMVVYVIILNDAERRIPVQYSKKMQGRKMVGGQSSHIPLKVNTSGVMPVIFASSIMSFPVIIGQFLNVDYSTIGGKILMVLSSSNWLVPERPVYSIGLVIYIVLLILFAYFYTSITFNPLEIANNMKKQGGFIPGIRPGKPTSDYLNKILNYIVFIGAVGLTVVAILPIAFSGMFSITRISFSGTSLIIIVSVILETIKSIESKMLVRNYRGFLND